MKTLTVKKLIIPLSIGAFLLLGYLALRPIMNVHADECIRLEAEIFNVYAGPSHDIIFVVAGDTRTFYINRGEEAGLMADDLKGQLKGKKVSLWYVDHWSLLNYKKRLCHVSRLEFDEDVLFTEIVDM